MLLRRVDAHAQEELSHVLVVIPPKAVVGSTVTDATLNIPGHPWCLRKTPSHKTPSTKGSKVRPTPSLTDQKKAPFPQKELLSRAVTDGRLHRRCRGLRPGRVHLHFGGAARDLPFHEVPQGLPHQRAQRGARDVLLGEL